jgi:hypothetical protein
MSKVMQVQAHRHPADKSRITRPPNGRSVVGRDPEQQLVIGAAHPSIFKPGTVREQV